MNKKSKYLKDWISLEKKKVSRFGLVWLDLFVAVLVALSYQSILFHTRLDTSKFSLQIESQQVAADISSMPHQTCSISREPIEVDWNLSTGWHLIKKTDDFTENDHGLFSILLMAFVESVIGKLWIIEGNLVPSKCLPTSKLDENSRLMKHCEIAG